MSIKKTLATAYLLDSNNKEAIDYLAEQIASGFSLLANMEPGAALEVLNQMNEQYNEEIADSLIESRNKQLDKMAAAMCISPDQLED